jgi:hypothetical protein
VLKEQGRDPTKEEQAQEDSRASRDESEEETRLKAKIAALQQRIAGAEGGAAADKAGAETPQVAPADAEDSETTAAKPATSWSKIASKEPTPEDPANADDSESKASASSRDRQELEDLQQQLSKLSAGQNDKQRSPERPAASSAWRRQA